MKIYAINQEYQITEMTFESEDSADDAFNSVIQVDGLTPLKDDAGETKMIDVSFGYSPKRIDMVSAAVADR